MLTLSKYSWPPSLRALYPVSTANQKHSEKDSRKFQKAKLEFATLQKATVLFIQHLHCIYNYLRSIDIVLGIRSNLEMI